MSTPQAAPPVVRERVEAAAVAAAREEIVRALGPLAASPLNEPAVQRMRRALARADSPAVRAAVRRLRFLVTSPCVNGEMPLTVGSRGDRARRWPLAYPGIGVCRARSGHCSRLGGCLVSRVLSLVRSQAPRP